jgi:hypothetical protein
MMRKFLQSFRATLRGVPRENRAIDRISTVSTDARERFLSVSFVRWYGVAMRILQ